MNKKTKPSNPVAYSEFKTETKKIIKSFNKKFDLLENKIGFLDKKIDLVDKKIDSVDKRLSNEIKITEAVLREEIRITAEETKQEIKEEITRQNQKILNTMDSFLQEILKSREEQILIPHQISDHELRISSLETKVGQTKTQSFV